MEDGIVQRHGERIAALQASYQHLATKDDISKLRLELEKSVNRLQVDLEQSVNRLQVELEQSVNRLQANIDALKWVITLGIGAAAVVLAAIQVVVALALRA